MHTALTLSFFANVFSERVLMVMAQPAKTYFVGYDDDEAISKQCCMSSRYNKNCSKFEELTLTFIHIYIPNCKNIFFFEIFQIYFYYYRSCHAI